MKNLLPFLFVLVFASSATAATWHVAPGGSDANPGTLAAPLATLPAAIDLASPGDEILLRQGTYTSEEIRITKSDLTIRSYPGEWATLVATMNDPDIASCIWYNEPDVSGGLLENLEIIGGYYYGVSFETNWDWGVPAANRHGASNITLRNCRIHDTGRDCIKIKPGCDNIQILSCELFNSGVGPGNNPADPNAEGIDNVNGDGMVVRNCHIHHTSTTGVYAKGGATNCIIEGNLLRETGEAGILLGFYTDADFFDTGVNPDYYECRNSIARNNILIGTGGAGIGFFAAYQCAAYHNTVITASPKFHAPIFFNTGDIWISSSLTLNPPNVDVQVYDNIFVDQSPNTQDDYTLQVRPNALSGNTQIHHNLYYKTTGPASFEDGVNWPARTFSQWQTAGFDASSMEADPLLDANQHLSLGSPAIDAGQGGASDDYDGDLRSIGPASDLGADEHNPATVLPTPPPAGVIGTGLNGLVLSLVHHLPTLAITVSPNPSIDWLQAEGAAIERLSLFDLQGRPIRNASGSRLYVGDLPAGGYLLRAQGRHGSATRNVVVAH
jgi:Right handed beta helix region